MRRAGQKSTVASYVAVGLPKAGQRVATIDPDARQQSLTRYVNNRRAWAAHTGLDLEVPAHFCIEQGRAMQIADNEELECLLSQLQLQLNERARRRAAGRAEWFSQVGKPLQSDELFAA